MELALLSDSTLLTPAVKMQLGRSQLWMVHLLLVEVARS